MKSKAYFRFYPRPRTATLPEDIFFATPFAATFDPSVKPLDHCYAHRLIGPRKCTYGPVDFFPCSSANRIAPRLIENEAKIFFPYVSQSLMNLHASPRLMGTSFHTTGARGQKVSSYFRSYGDGYRDILVTAPSVYRVLARAVELIQYDSTRWDDPDHADYVLASTGLNLAFWGVHDTYLAAALNWMALTFEVYERYLQCLEGERWRKGYLGLRMVRQSLLQTHQRLGMLGTKEERERGNIVTPLDTETFFREGGTTWRRSPPPGEPP